MDNNTLRENDRSNLGVIKDPTVKLKPGKKLQNYLSAENTLDGFSSFLPKDKQYLSIGDIKQLMKNLHSKNMYLNDMLDGSELITPSLEIPPRNPELEQRKEKLRKMLAQQDYNRMTQNVDFTTRYKPEDSIGYQSKQKSECFITKNLFIVLQ